MRGMWLRLISLRKMFTIAIEVNSTETTLMIELGKLQINSFRSTLETNHLHLI